MQYIDRCIEDFVQLPRAEFMALYNVPVLVFAPREAKIGGGFDFQRTQLLRAPNFAHPASHSQLSTVALLKKRPGVMGRQISVGRTQATDICLDAPDVSTLHAYFLCEAGAYTLTDIGSKNGTRLQGASLAPNTAAPIHNAMRVAFGGHEAVFYSPEGFHTWLQRTMAELRQTVHHV